MYLTIWNWASPEVKALTLILKYEKPARKKSQAALRELTAGFVSICPLFVRVPLTLTHGPVVGSSRQPHTRQRKGAKQSAREIKTTTLSTLFDEALAAHVTARDGLWFWVPIMQAAQGFDRSHQAFPPSIDKQPIRVGPKARHWYQSRYPVRTWTSRLRCNNAVLQPAWWEQVRMRG